MMPHSDVPHMNSMLHQDVLGKVIQPLFQLLHVAVIAIRNAALKAILKSTGGNCSKNTIHTVNSSKNKSH